MISLPETRVVETQLRVLGEPLRIGETVTKAGEHRERPPPAHISKHLCQVTSLTQAEPVLVRSPPEDWSSECFQCCSVVQHQVYVIS